jgi:hypothetical protein
MPGLEVPLVMLLLELESKSSSAGNFSIETGMIKKEKVEILISVPVVAIG